MKGYTNIDGEVILQRLQDYAMSIRTLAKLIGCDNSGLGKALRGECSVSIDNAEKICKLLDLTMQEIVKKPEETKANDDIATQPVNQNISVNVDITEIVDLLGKIYRTEVGTRNLIQVQIENLKEETQKIITELTAIKAMSAETKAELGLLHDTVKERLPKRN